MRIALFLATTVIGFSIQAYDFTPNSKAQAAKQAQRWSLAEWMEQKGRIRWMDVWLNYNSTPTYSEIYIGADHSIYDRSSVGTGPLTLNDAEFKATRGYLGGFVSIFGLHGSYEKSSDENRELWEAFAMLRLLGSTDQGSNLTLFYGLRGEELELTNQVEGVQNQQAGGYLTLYLFSAWAIQGKYQHYFEEQSDLLNNVEGHRIEASTWIEYGALRFYGTWFKEPLTFSNATGSVEVERQGFNAGFRLYLDIKK